MIKFKDKEELSGFKLRFNEIKMNEEILSELEQKYLIKKDVSIEKNINSIKSIIDNQKDLFINFFGVNYDDFSDINVDELTLNNEKDDIYNEIEKSFIVNQKKEKNNDFDYDSFYKDNDIPYDLVTMPSKGMIAPYKRDKIPVAYLTAEDEDIITSPNLYKDDKIIDYLLNKKILDKSIKVDNLPEGDKDAIIIWLRATAYGNEYPVSVIHPASGELFETECDLSKLEMKPFNLVSDDDGYFFYLLPLSKDEVKFKFLSVGETKKLKETILKENFKNKKIYLNEISKTLKNFINTDEILNVDERTNIVNLSKKVDDWADKLSKDNNLISNYVTTRLENHIISINGIEDKKYIKNYIKTMRAGDSLALRKYINNNEPGMNLSFNVDVPSDLGGGQINSFLDIESSFFINIP